ncbi:MAG: hypothetical protein QM758_30335 [Armatimonas sp.]
MGQRVMRWRALVLLGFISLVAGCAAETPVADAPAPGAPGTRSASASAPGGGGGNPGNSNMPPMTPEQQQHGAAMTQGYSKAYAEAAAARQKQVRR